MFKYLFIVELFVKVKMINKYFGKDFIVLVLYGYVCDLVLKEGVVDFDNNFVMCYDLIEKNEKYVDVIVKVVKGVDDIFLVIDLDCEGEVISWYIVEILKECGLVKDKLMQCVVFIEIMLCVIKEVMSQLCVIVGDLVDVQQVCCVFDYLVGFNFFLVLWCKVQCGLFVGCVQSLVLCMIVECEEEIEVFIVCEYWSIDVECVYLLQYFNVCLIKFDGKKFEQFMVIDGDIVEDVWMCIQQVVQGVLYVIDVVSKECKCCLVLLFIIFMLQQEVLCKFGFIMCKIMQVVQKLYEGVVIGDEGMVGLILYMCIDLVNLLQDVLVEICDVIVCDYGIVVLLDKFNIYQIKFKNVQEVYEVVCLILVLWILVQVLCYFIDDECKFYELIWKCVVVCQMILVMFNMVSVDLLVGSEYVFCVSGIIVVVFGFLVVYEEGKDNKSVEDDDEGCKLLVMKFGDCVLFECILVEQYFIQLLLCFIEVVLVKVLEEYGIGCLLIYVLIIQMLLFCKYVEMEGCSFCLLDVGCVVFKFLFSYFIQYVDYDFIVKFEDEFDVVLCGEEDWILLMVCFWELFNKLVEEKKELVDWVEVSGVCELGIDFKIGKLVSVCLGCFGLYVVIGSIVEDVEDKLKFVLLCFGQLMYIILLEDVLELFLMLCVLGQDNGEDVSVGIGCFGLFVKCGSIYVLLKKEDDFYMIDFV